MVRSFDTFVLKMLLLAGVVVAIAGCQSRTRQDYVPTAAAAEEALKSVLDAWQRGEPPGRIEGEPAIQVGDTHRRAGQKLARYEIAGELPTQEGRLFAIRATFASPAAEEKIHYVVVGIDPLWVLRQEDYHTMTRWEHNMTPAEKTAKAEASDDKAIRSAKAE
jgi:hypothetical protein